MSDSIGLNVANSSLPISPSNCVPLSPSSNLWNIALFFAANIFAHAATIHSRTGATKFNSFQRMCLMLVAPITAGTVATYAIVTFILGIKNRGIKWAAFLDSREGLEDAVPAEGVGILIPRDLAPVVAGRWKLVGAERHSLLLDHKKLDTDSREPHIPEPGASLQFILPPQSRLPGYKHHKFYPSSSFANEFIAVVQLIYGIYQLVSQFGGEFQVMGLSSPYVFAIPYLFMSLVNLVANMVMPSFTHIVILPPNNRISRSSSLTLKKRAIELQSIDSSNGTPHANKLVQESSSTRRESEDNTSETSGDLEKCNNEKTLVRRSWRIGKFCAREEYEWDEQYLVMSSILRRGRNPENPLTKRERKKLMAIRHPKFSFITWKIDWWWWGKKSFRRSSSWSIETNPTPEQERELEMWLEEHYPGVEASIRERPLRVYQYSRYAAVGVTLAVTTILLGALTRFRFMVGLYAGRNISWIYGPPAFLLLPFFFLEARGKTMRFYATVEGLSSTVHNLISAAYFGAIIQLGLALYSVGDCSVWSQADNQTWLT
jgi:hypothetical protein